MIISEVPSRQPAASFKVSLLLAPKREETLTFAKVVGALCVAHISSDILGDNQGK